MTLPRRRWLPAVHAELEALLSEDGAGRVAAFDFDQTCLTGDIGESLLKALGPEVFAEYERLDEEEGHEVSYPWCAAALGGQSIAELTNFVGVTSGRCLGDLSIRIRPEIVDLQQALRARGWDVWVVTASARRAVLPLAAMYGFAPDHVLGMELREEGNWIHREVVGRITYRQGKVDAVRGATGRTPDFAAGDSITDLELLQSATHRLLLDRGAPHVNEHAVEEGWWVQPAFQ
ncbi:MAG: haloacid dehalogenase-like hydrolase [Proteobacteria bacterium]|nr:haloacid dehalogenase-like hydrolase [Pseudomonadota bacterium]